MRTLRSLITLLVALAMTLAACDPTPSVTPAPSPSQPPVTVASPTPQPTSSPAPSGSPAPSTRQPPSPVAVPPELAQVPWADFDREESVLTVGLLGQPASLTRTTPDWPARILYSGRFVVTMTYEHRIEVIDAADGRTVTTYDWPTGAETDFDLSADPTGEFLYFSRWVDNVGLLSRMRHDGTDVVELVSLGTRSHPEEGHGGYVVRSDGWVVVVRCPPQSGSSANPRCSLETIPPGDAPGRSIRTFPRSTPPICHLLGATLNNVIVTTADDYTSCNADGGFVEISWLTIDLDDLSFHQVPMNRSNVDEIGFVELAPNKPRLVGVGRLPEPDVFWPYRPSLLQNMRTGQTKVLIPPGDIFEGEFDDGSFHVWMPFRIIGDWVLAEGAGAGYLRCRLDGEFKVACPPDVVGLWNVKTQEFIRLPFGTFADRHTIAR